MKPVLASISLAGGAGGATKRLFRSLRALGENAHVLVDAVTDEEGEDPRIVQVKRPVLSPWNFGHKDLSVVRRYRDRKTSHFSPAIGKSKLVEHARALAPDVLNLHWVLGGFFHIESLIGFDRPIVWTLHDQWAFTGGCHYSGGCERFLDMCGACPILGSDAAHDLSRDVLTRKLDAWRGLDATVVAPSRWLADQARASSVFRDRRVEVIPYSIDLDTFRPPEADERARTRAELGLSVDQVCVLFGAWDGAPRKGIAILAEALRALGVRRTDVVGVRFGSGGADDFGIPVKHLGSIADPARLARIYGAADVFVLPSLEDNLPTTVIEASGCGAPSVGFRIGGVPDLIANGETGLVLDEVGDSGALAAAIETLVNDRDVRERFGRAARRKAARDYAFPIEAERYRALFAELAQGRG